LQALHRFFWIFLILALSDIEKLHLFLGLDMLFSAIRKMISARSRYVVNISNLFQLNIITNCNTIMDKSHTVSVRLSNRELEAIEKFQEKYGIKLQNDFFRASSAFFISMVDTLVRLVTSKELNSKVDQFYNELKTELEKIPSTKAKLQGKFEEYENIVLPKFEQEIDKGVEQVKPFAQERSAGRPPKPKAGPGRPKEQEYKK